MEKQDLSCACVIVFIMTVIITVIMTMIRLNVRIRIRIMIGTKLPAFCHAKEPCR